MGWKLKADRCLAVVATLAVVLLIATAPTLEDCAAYMVAVVCTGIGLFGISLIRDPHERMILVRLFCAAFALRLAFTCLVYKTGLVNVIGGADDVGWELSWDDSRYWVGWYANAPTLKQVPGQGVLPYTLWDVYDGSRQGNMGYHYWSAYFYYLLNVPSQMALSFLNCFMNSLTVLVIYKVARSYFDEAASKFAAWAAIVMPGFLAWSALSLKETWVILFEITLFFAVYRVSRTRSVAYFLLAAVMLFLIFGMRFYVAYFLLAATALTLLCDRSHQPFRTAGYYLAGGAVLYVILSKLGVVHFDIAKVYASRMMDLSGFREGVSSAGVKFHGQKYGGNSSIDLHYDIRTPGGLAMMLLVGSAYLLLSPFPWQALSGRQIFALPDVLWWWGLMFAFILPGIRYSARRRAPMLLSIVAFVLPLIWLYSMVFGNVGLAYRQRAQLMPFLLVLAAAGHERRRREVRRKAPASAQTIRLRPSLGSLSAPRTLQS